MVKERLFIVVCFCFFLVPNGYGQKFNYNSQKKQNSEYNEELSEALRNDDAQAIRRILTNNPSLVDAASYCEISKRLRNKISIPLIWDAVQRCLDKQCSVKVVETILEFHPNLNCRFDGLPPFYLILDYLARHKTSECDRAKELFFLFLNKSSIDIKERPADLPPSFSYLLTENYNHLHGKFSKDYISSDIIKAFIDRGASINTKDVNSNSILTFATLTQNQELVNYCLGEGANVGSTNLAGKDAFYYAVANNDYVSVKNIIESGYPLTVKRIVSMDMKQAISQSGDEIQNLMFDKLRVGEKNFSELQTLLTYFPNQKGGFLSQGFQRSKLDVNRNELSEVIDMIAQSQLDNTAANNLMSLKIEYIASASDLSSFAAAIGKYPIYPFHYSSNYYEKGTSYEALLSDLQSLKSYFHSNLIDQLCQEANDRKNRFIDSDWKGNPKVGKKVVDGYPYMYDEVVEELFKEIAKMSNGRNDYSHELTNYLIKDELDNLDRQIRYCDDFISCFSDSNYAEKAIEKRNILKNRKAYVEECMSSWEHKINYAKQELESLKDYVIKRGNTPYYKTKGNWKNVGGSGMFGVFSEDRYEIYYEIKLEDSWTISGSGVYILKGENTGYYYAYLNGATSWPIETRSIDEAIRSVVWNYLYINIEKGNNSNNGDQRILLVEFLKQNKNGEWWKYGK